VIPACGKIFQAGFFVAIARWSDGGAHVRRPRPRRSRRPDPLLRPETRLVHSGTLRSQFGETSEALFLTQGFVYDTAEQCEARFTGEDDGFIYSRFSNPTVAMFEQRMIELEGAEAARATATGMAAVTTAILAPLKAGDHVVARRRCSAPAVMSWKTLLPRYGIESTLVDGHDLDQWKKAMRPNTKSCFLESPTNPTLDVLDIAAVATSRTAAARG
jgi:O-succinylhomoserine sulfhydrylase